MELKLNRGKSTSVKMALAFLLELGNASSLWAFFLIYYKSHFDHLQAYIRDCVRQILHDTPRHFLLDHLKYLTLLCINKYFMNCRFIYIYMQC